MLGEVGRVPLTPANANPIQSVSPSVVDPERVSAGDAGVVVVDVLAFVGAPNARNGAGDGNYILQWIKTGAWSGSSHYVLSFDRYGVC
jgi:hypothetical protein